MSCICARTYGGRVRVNSKQLYSSSEIIWLFSNPLQAKDYILNDLKATINFNT